MRSKVLYKAFMTKKQWIDDQGKHQRTVLTGTVLGHTTHHVYLNDAGIPLTSRNAIGFTSVEVPKHNLQMCTFGYHAGTRAFVRSRILHRNKDGSCNRHMRWNGDKRFYLRRCSCPRPSDYRVFRVRLYNPMRSAVSQKQGGIAGSILASGSPGKWVGTHFTILGVGGLLMSKPRKGVRP